MTADELRDELRRRAGGEFTEEEFAAMSPEELMRGAAKAGGGQKRLTDPLIWRR